MRRQPCRQPHRRNHTARIGDAPAGDIERRAVIDRRPHDRQTERDVHGLAERDELHRNQPLIVIAGDDDVELAADGAHENRVARKGARDVDAVRAAGGNRGPDDAILFLAEQPVLARVRIEPGHGDARRRNIEPGQLAGRQRNRRFQRRLSQRARHLRQRDVHGRQHDAQGVGVEHHRDVARAGQMRQQIGVSRPGQAGQPERFLVDGRGRDGVHGATLRVGGRANEQIVGGASGVCAQDAGREHGAGRRRVEHRLTDLEHGSIGRRARRDFRADARRVADRDRHAGLHRTSQGSTVLTF